MNYNGRNIFVDGVVTFVSSQGPAMIVKTDPPPPHASRDDAQYDKRIRIQDRYDANQVVKVFPTAGNRPRRMVRERNPVNYAVGSHCSNTFFVDWPSFVFIGTHFL